MPERKNNGTFEFGSEGLDNSPNNVINKSNIFFNTF